MAYPSSNFTTKNSCEQSLCTPGISQALMSYTSGPPWSPSDEGVFEVQQSQHGLSITWLASTFHHHDVMKENRFNHSEVLKL